MTGGLGSDRYPDAVALDLVFGSSQFVLDLGRRNIKATQVQDPAEHTVGRAVTASATKRTEQYAGAARDEDR